MGDYQLGAIISLEAQFIGECIDVSRVSDPIVKDDRVQKVFLVIDGPRKGDILAECAVPRL